MSNNRSLWVAGGLGALIIGLAIFLMVKSWFSPSDDPVMVEPSNQTTSEVVSTPYEDTSHDEKFFDPDGNEIEGIRQHDDIDEAVVLGIDPPAPSIEDVGHGNENDDDGALQAAIQFLDAYYADVPFEEWVDNITPMLAPWLVEDIALKGVWDILPYEPEYEVETIDYGDYEETIRVVLNGDQDAFLILMSMVPDTWKVAQITK